MSEKHTYGCSKDAPTKKACSFNYNKDLTDTKGKILTGYTQLPKDDQVNFIFR